MDATDDCGQQKFRPWLQTPDGMLSLRAMYTLVHHIRCRD